MPDPLIHPETLILLRMKDNALREELVKLLLERQAHVLFEDAVAGIPAEHINTVPPGCDYSFWQVVEHLRICQRDILDYITSDNYTWLGFPDDLWPDKSVKADQNEWQASIHSFLTDRQALVDIVRNEATDLFAPLANSGEHKHTVLREVQVIGSHNAYHTGALVIMQQNLGIWQPPGLDLDALFSAE